MSVKLLLVFLFWQTFAWTLENFKLFEHGAATQNGGDRTRAARRVVGLRGRNQDRLLQPDQPIIIIAINMKKILSRGRGDKELRAHNPTEYPPENTKKDFFLFKNWTTATYFLEPPLRDEN